MEIPTPNYSVPIIIYGSHDTDAFSPGPRTPHVPVISAFGHGPLHRFRMQGKWDLNRAVEENTSALLRSDRLLEKNSKEMKWDDLTFRFTSTALLYVTPVYLEGFSDSAAGAEAVVRRFAEKYFLHPENPAQPI